MKAETYFVRWRGEVAGPYDIPALKGMLATGELTRHHQISADQKSWAPLMSVLDAAQSAAEKAKTAFLKAAPPQSVEIAQSMPVNHSTETIRISKDANRNQSSEAPSHPSLLTKDGAKSAPPVFPTTPESWFYFNEGQIYGPTPFGVLQSMAAQGILHADSQVLKEGDLFWRPLHQVAGMTCNPLVPAGFLQRALALVIDGAVLGCICSIWLLLLYMFLLFCGLGKNEINILLKSFGSLLSVLIIWIYFSCLESSADITTFGKMAVDITVVDEYGRPILYGRANARFWSKLISSFLFIGFFMAAFTNRKQALHDLIAKTLVIQMNNNRRG